MALTPEQIQQLSQRFRGKVSIGAGPGVAAQASPQTSPDQLTGADAGIRHVSDALTSLGLGMIPQAAGASYEGARATANAFGAKDVYSRPDLVNPFLSTQTLGQYSTPVGAAQETAKNIAGADSWAIGGLNPIGWGAKPVLGRAALGGLSGLAYNLSQGRGKDVKSDITSAGIGAATNAVLPQLISDATGKIAKLAYGKTGPMLPAVGEETGQTVTGIGSPGAKAAASDIGQKIGDVYGAMGTGMTKNQVFNQFNDVPELTQTGLTSPTNLDYFLKNAGIAAEDKPAAQQMIQTMGNNSLTRLQGALAGKQTQATSGMLGKEFNAALNSYLADNPDIAQQVTEQGVDNVELPAGFWQQFKQAVRPSNKVYEQMARDPSFIPNVEDKMRMSLTENISSMLKNQVSKETPQAASRLAQLNKLYSAIQPIAQGSAKPSIGGNISRMAPLAGAALLASPMLGMKLSPYLSLLGTLGILMNPQASGTLASQSAQPVGQALLNAVTNIGANKLFNQNAKQ